MTFMNSASCIQIFGLVEEHSPVSQQTADQAGGSQTSDLAGEIHEQFLLHVLPAKIN